MNSVFWFSCIIGKSRLSNRNHDVNRMPPGPTTRDSSARYASVWTWVRWVKTEIATTSENSLVCRTAGAVQRLVGARVERAVEHVVMVELEPGRERSEVLVAPPDHPGVEIEPDVALGARPLKDQLACQAPAAAAEVQHVGILGRHTGEHRSRRWDCQTAPVG